MVLALAGFLALFGDVVYHNKASKAPKFGRQLCGTSQTKEYRTVQQSIVLSQFAETGCVERAVPGAESWSEDHWRSHTLCFAAVKSEASTDFNRATRSSFSSLLHATLDHSASGVCISPLKRQLTSRPTSNELAVLPRASSSRLSPTSPVDRLRQ